MSADLSDETLLKSRVSVPDHVTCRDFPDEMVVLNLDSGMYHGLNQTAARMLEKLRASDDVNAAIDELTLEFEQPREVIQADVLGLCRALRERGLLDTDSPR